MKSVLLKGFIRFAIALGVCNVFLFISVLPPIGGHYRIPSHSMSPTLNVGDHIYVSKFAYTFSQTRVPSRGDIILFKNKKMKLNYIKRVIGLPGDQIEMTRGRLYVNGSIIDRKLQDELIVQWGNRPATAAKLYEQRLDQTSQSFSIFENTDDGLLDNLSVFNVPKGHVFVMGDNRDNSSDSRVSVLRGGVRYVPIENIAGEAKRVLFPTNFCRDDGELYCPPRRFFKKL